MTIQPDLNRDDAIVDGVDVQDPEVAYDDTSHEESQVDSTDTQQTEEEIPVVDTAEESVQQTEIQAPQDETEVAGSVEPVFDATYLAAAGLTAEEAKSQFGTPDALAHAVRMLDSRFVQLGKEVLNQGKVAPSAHRPADEHQQQKPGDEKSTDSDAPFQLPKAPTGEDWDEDTKTLIKSVTEHFEKQLLLQRQQLQEALGQQQTETQKILQERQRQEQLEYVQGFDGFVEKLGETWKPLLGSGSGFELPKDSLAYQNRVHLDQVAAQLKKGLEIQGQPELTRDQLLSRALQIAFPEQQKLAVKKEVTQQIVQRQKMMTQRPTAKKSDTKSPIDKAAATATKWYQDHGFAVHEDEEDYSDI